MSSAKWRPFCLGLNVLIVCISLSPNISDTLKYLSGVFFKQMFCGLFVWTKCKHVYQANQWSNVGPGT